MKGVANITVEVVCESGRKHSARIRLNAPGAEQEDIPDYMQYLGCCIYTAMELGHYEGESRCQ